MKVSFDKLEVTEHEKCTYKIDVERFIFQQCMFLTSLECILY